MSNAFFRVVNARLAVIRRTRLYLWPPASSFIVQRRNDVIRINAHHAVHNMSEYVDGLRGWVI